ncbi:hypothetical protein BGX30_005822, partial [Mortierella sp. GBA39]
TGNPLNGDPHRHSGLQKQYLRRPCTPLRYATPAADIIQIDERPPPFVNTVLSRRVDTPAKLETGDRVWHYRR